MRSVRGVAAASLALATIPLAIITGNAFGNDAAETTIHFSVGLGFLLFAVAVFDFGLPSWAAATSSVKRIVIASNSSVIASISFSQLR